MAINLITEVPSDLGDELAKLILSIEVSAAADANAMWYLEQWDLGRKPPCCPKCANVAYRPAQAKMNEWCVVLAPLLLQRNVASCESVAAMHTGHKRAEVIRAELDKGATLVDALIAARKRFQVLLEDTETPRYYHVVSIDDGVRVDGTKGMR